MVVFSQIIAVGVGGALGAVSRYLVVSLVVRYMEKHPHWATFAVNFIGSFCLGLAFVFIVERLASDGLLRPLIMVGFLGAFTTFSTFSLEIINLAEEGRYFDAGAYIVLSVILCALATGAAIALGRSMMSG